MDQKSKIKNALKKVFKVLKITTLLLMLVVITVGAYLGNKFYPKYKEMSAEADKTIEQVDKRTFVRLDPTVIHRKDGTFVRKFEPAPYVYLNEDEMPQVVKDAFISIEDKNFYDHGGFDIVANIRAVKTLIQNKGRITQGGSTITQQLVRNTFLTFEQSYERKVKEILLAVRLENKLTKDQILEYYINNIYYGNGAYGIETAANYYFSESVHNLTLSEVAFLAAIPNNPTIFNPITKIDNTLKRRDKIINHMYDEEVISESEMIEAKNEKIVLNVKPKDKYEPESYEVSYVMSSATKLIMEHEGFKIRFDFKDNADRNQYNKKFKEKFDEVHKRLRIGGYEIVSTIDAAKQNELQESINNGLSMFSSVNPESGLYKTQGAGVVIDNKTNELVAIVGGRTQENVANTFNRAFLSYRQPGSVIKPIIIYGVEIDDGMLSSTIVHDIKDVDGPRNAGGRYRGAMSAGEALQRSINTVPFDLLKERGNYSAHEYMKRMGFSKIVDEDAGPGISIGGFTYGATPLEINGAFGTLANNGNYIPPTGIDSIKFDGEIIYENKKPSTRVYNDGTAYLLTDMLKGVLNERHGTGYGLALKGNMPAAAKTGTTDANKDGWFVGYTPYYTTTIWVGNDLPAQIKNLYGGNYPGRIWKNYMDKIHQGLPKEDFKMPKGAKMMYLNPKTGDISEVSKPGYTNYEIIPSTYITSIQGERSAEMELIREKEIKEWLAEESRKQEFMSKYGIPEDEEIRNRSNVEFKINQAINVNIICSSYC